MEVKQALALIKERVEEIKQDDKWKEKLQAEARREEIREQIRKERRDDDARSIASSQVSVRSMKEEAME